MTIEADHLTQNTTLLEVGHSPVSRRLRHAAAKLTIAKEPERRLCNHPGVTWRY